MLACILASSGRRRPIGYMLDMKVEKEKNRFYVVFWLPTRSYHKILMIWIFELLRKLVNSGHFFPWKFLCIGRNLAKTCQWKKCWLKAWGKTLEEAKTNPDSQGVGVWGTLMPSICGTGGEHIGNLGNILRTWGTYREPIENLKVT
jgi:hypothetical protein